MVLLCNFLALTLTPHYLVFIKNKISREIMDKKWTQNVAVDMDTEVLYVPVLVWVTSTN